MIIDLKKIPIFWTTCDKYKDRQNSIEQSFKSFGIENAEMISGPLNTPYSIAFADNVKINGDFDDGMAKGYIKAINQYNPPFLVLEDDVKPLLNNFNINNFDPINVQDDIDAIYLGTSVYGRVAGRTLDQCVIAEPYDDRFYQIKNMLSLHAVVYTSKKYIDHVTSTLLGYIDDVQNKRWSGARTLNVNQSGNFCEIDIHYGADDRIADTMHKYKILAVKQPIFYQDDGHSNAPTMEPLKIKYGDMYM